MAYGNLNLNISGNTAGATGNINTGTITIAGGNNITVSQNGNAITISGANVGGAQTGISGLSAGTTQMTSGTAVFSNLNGISFGVNGNTITASHNGLTTQSGQAFSADASSTFQTLVFQDSNGVSFSNNAGSLRVTHELQYTSNTSAITSNALNTSSPRVNISAGTTSNNLSDFVFSNSNNVSFGLNGSTVTGSASFNQTAQPVAISGSNGSFNFSTVTFGNLNGLSFYTSNNSMVGSYTVPTVTNSSATISAGTTSNTIGNLVFSNSNGVSFGLNAGTVTATVKTDYLTTARASNDAVGLNTALTAGPLAWTVNSSGISLNAGSAAGTTSGFAGNSISGSITHNTAGINISLNHPAWLTTAMQSNAATISNINVSAGTTSNNLSAVTFSNSNGVSFGLNGSVMTATVKTDYLTTARASTDAVGLNTALTAGPLAWTVNSSGISLNAGSAAGTTSGFAGNSISGSITHNTAGINISLNHPAWLTTAMQSNAATISNINISAGTTSTNASAFTFSNSNGVSFGLGTGVNAGILTATVQTNYLTTARASSDAIGLNTAQSNVTWTVNSSGLSLDARGYVGTATGFSGTNVSATMTHNSAGFSLQLSAAAGGGAAIKGSGTYTQNTGTVEFANSNGITFGLSNNGTMTASHNGITTQTNQTLGLYALGNTTQNSSSTMDARTLSYNALGAMTMGFSNGSIQVSAPATSSLVGVGAITLSTNGSTISISGGTVASAPVGVSAGTTSNSLSQIVFSNSNNATFGLNGSTITVSAPVNFSAGTTSGNLTQVSFANSNGVSFGLNAGTITGSAGVMASWFQNQPFGPGMVTGASAITQTSGSSMFVQPFMLPYSISAGYFRFLASFNDSAVGTAGTTSANTSFSVERYSTFGLVIYSQGVGASSRSIQSIGSTSDGLTGRTVYTAGAQGSQYTISVLKTFPNSGAADGNYNTSYAVSSGSIVISSNSNTLFTGPRFLDISFATSFAPGNYWLAVGHSTSSASNSSNISFAGTAGMPISLAGVSQSNVSVGVLGAATSASDHQLVRGLGVFTTNASLFTTGSIGLNSISQVVSNPILPFQIIREA